MVGDSVYVFRSVFAVWRSLLDATAHTAASRLTAAEEYRRLNGKASRSLHNAKDVRAKKVSEYIFKKNLIRLKDTHAEWMI